MEPQRHRPLLASFSKQFKVPVLEADISDPRRQDFGEAGPGVVEDQKQQMIAPTSPRVVRGGQDGLDLLGAQQANQPLDLALERDAEDAWEGGG